MLYEPDCWLIRLSHIVSHSQERRTSVSRCSFNAVHGEWPSNSRRHIFSTSTIVWHIGFLGTRLARLIWTTCAILRIPGCQHSRTWALPPQRNIGALARVNRSFCSSDLCDLEYPSVALAARSLVTRGKCSPPSMCKYLRSSHAQRMWFHVCPCLIYICFLQFADFSIEELRDGPCGTYM